MQNKSWGSLFQWGILVNKYKYGGRLVPHKEFFINGIFNRLKRSF